MRGWLFYISEFYVSFEIRSGAFVFRWRGTSHRASRTVVERWCRRTHHADVANACAYISQLRLVRASGIRGRDVLARAIARQAAFRRRSASTFFASEKTAAGIVFRSYRRFIYPAATRGTHGPRHPSNVRVIFVTRQIHATDSP